MTVTLRSFAKINLGLRIGARREDGFHDLLTVYQTIALHDVVRVSVVRGSGIEIRCTDPGVPKDESNTCFRVVEMAMDALRAKGRVVIEIEKHLPVQGGLGGASSNAVAALLGLERALKKKLPATEKLRIAAAVGSDLPLFLVGGTVLGLGRGEQVYPLPDLPATPCVVVTPEIGVSTPNAFATWDSRMAQGLKPSFEGNANAALKGRSSTSPTVNSGQALKGHSSAVHSVRAELRSAGQPRAAVLTLLEPHPTSECAPGLVAKLTLSEPSDRMNELGRGVSAWLSEVYTGAPFGRGRAENPLLELVRAGIDNDFEQVVFPEYPELREAKSALVRAGARYASLSGSGSTLYGLFAAKRAAVQAAKRLQKQGWTTQAMATLPRRAYWRQVFGC